MAGDEHWRDLQRLGIISLLIATQKSKGLKDEASLVLGKDMNMNDPDMILKDDPVRSSPHRRTDGLFSYMHICYLFSF